jgi:hypothetical protein
MTKYVNGWTAQAGWVVLMGIVWLAFVPGAIATVNFVMFAVAGSAVLVAGGALWGAHQPTMSVSQARAAADASDSAGRRG